MDLKEWISQNHLEVVQTSDWIFEIAEVGKFYMLFPTKENKIVDQDFTFILTDEDIDRVERLKPDFFLFQFGARWYYSKLDCFVDSKRVTRYKFSLNEFMYLGKSAVDNGSFHHLGVHSCFELLNGSRYAEDWCKKAKFINMTSLGICDKNTLGGVLDFQMYCDKSQIKPIIGETVTVCYGYSETMQVNLLHEVKLYVKNKQGWKNLLHINKYINVDNHEKQFITEKELFKLSEGLVLVFTKESFTNDADSFHNVDRYLEHFTDCFFQIDSVVYESEQEDLRYLESLKFYFNTVCDILRPILINDSYYINKEESGVKKFLNEVDRKVEIQSKNQYFKTLDETIEILAPLFNEEKLYCESQGFDIIVEAINNTEKLVNMCDFRIPTGTAKIPKYEFSEIDNEEMFLNLIYKGFSNLEIEESQRQEYEDRVIKEFNVIKEGGLIDYFLIIWDIINWSRENGIYVGTGRGSIGGSLIAYLMEIITIDPIKHDLLFERFLNEARTKPEEFIEVEYSDGSHELIRPEKFNNISEEQKQHIQSYKNVFVKRQDSMPDVDTDFESARRDEVKQYISRRFGSEHVCNIGSYTTIKMKGGLKDFSRIKGLKFTYVNFVTKQIPDQLEYDWQDLIKFGIAKPEIIGSFVQNNHDICELLNFTLEQPRATSEHASAVVIVPKEDEDGNPMTIFDWMPIRKVKGVLVSEWSGKHIDKAGFLKEDILSLSQLDKFKMMIELIKKNRKIDIVLEKIPLDDKDTYRLFKRGYNEDVFQFTSGGLKAYSAKVKPENIEDLIAMNALYRPGPMKSNAHEDFADFKHGRKKPKFDKGLESVTENTYGLYVYQEQIMKGMVEAGLTLVDADNARTAIKKFDKKLLTSYGERFIQGLIVNHKYDKQEATKVWDKLLAFSGYGFNKSHSAAYTLMGYWSQYLKCHYPLEFWTSSLNFCSDSEEIPSRLSEIDKLKLDINILPPDINYSGKVFSCDLKTNTIYWSFSKIKGFADSSVNEIIETRKVVGKFKSFEHFIESVKKNKVNKSKIKALILSGAFDSVEKIETPENRISLIKKYSDIIGEDLLESFEKRNIDKEFYWISLQKEITGFGNVDYKSVLKNRLKNFDKNLYLQYKDAHDFMQPRQDWTKVCVVGVLTNAVERDSKRGKYVRFYIDSNNQVIQGNLWNEQYLNFPNIVNLKNKLVAISGVIKFDTYSGGNCLQSSDNTKVIEL